MLFQVVIIKSTIGFLKGCTIGSYIRHWNAMTNGEKKYFGSFYNNQFFLYNYCFVVFGFTYLSVCDSVVFVLSDT